MAAHATSGQGDPTTASVIACPRCGARNRVPAAATGRPRCAKCRANLPWMVDAGDDTFAERAESSPLPVVVDLWAPWCGPCRALSPALERVAGDLAGRIKLVKVNVDDNPRTQARYGVQSIPTLLLLDGGQVVSRTVGAQPASALRQWIEQGLASRPG